MRALLRAARPLGLGLERLLPAAAAPLAAAAAAGGPSAACWSQQRLFAQGRDGQGSSSVEEPPTSMPSSGGSGGGSSASSFAAGGAAQPHGNASGPDLHTHEQHHPYDQAHPYSLSEEEEDARQHYRRPQDDAAFQQQRRQLLDAALRHVPTVGWAGGAAAAAAADELGLSPAAAGILGSDAEFVQSFVEDCNRRLEGELAALQGKLAEMDTRERLHLGLTLRLRMLEPYLAQWAQGLALLAQPQAAPRTLELYADLADTIWHAAGDAATDLSWYTKRALLVGAYSASELYMLTDCSPGYADTWEQLDRRLGDALELGKAARDAGSLTAAVGGALGDALAGLLGGAAGRRGGPAPPL